MEEFKKAYSLKGVGSPVYYLGGDIIDLSKLWKDEGLVIGLSVETYIKRIVENLKEKLERRPIKQEHINEFGQHGNTGQPNVYEYG